MRFKVVRKQFEDGLHAMQNVADGRATLPVLSQVLLQASEEGKLVLTASDLELTVMRGIQAEVGQAGTATLPARKLFDFVRSISAPEIEVDIEKQVGTIKAGSTDFKLHGMDPGDYPPLPKFEDDRKFTVEQQWMEAAIRYTKYAASEEQARYVLNGALFDIKDSKLALVATDGRRMALMDGQKPVTDREDSLRIIVPTRVVGELGRLLSREGGTMHLRSSESQVSFTLLDKDGVVTHMMMAQIMEGSFPDYRRVIPEEKDTKFRIPVDRGELTKALITAGIMTDQNNASVNLFLGKNELVLEGKLPGEGDVRVKIVVNYDGEEIHMAHNPHFLLDPLKQMEGDEIFLLGTDSLSPLLIREEGTPFLFVVMPFRAN